MLFKLALRNALRYKRRSAVTALAIAFGLGLAVVGLSLYNGVEKSTLENIKASETAHFLVFAEGYFARKDELPTDRLIRDPDRVKRLLRRIPDILAVESRLRCGATLIKDDDEFPGVAIGVEPETDASLFSIKKSLVRGEFLALADRESLLLGVDLAADIGLSVGDVCTLRLFSSTETIRWNALDVEVKGLFETGNPRVDRTAMFIPLGLAQEGLGIGNEATEIAVRLKNERHLPEVQSAIRATLSGLGGRYEVISYRDIVSDLIQVSRLRSRVHAIIPLIMLLVATLGIVNTMLMAVMERTREIGLLMAMGLNKAKVMLLFMFEGGIIGFCGSLGSCLIGGLGGWYLQVKGIDISFLGKDVARIAASIYPIKNVFHGELTFTILLFVLAFGSGVSILASLYPAWRAIRLDPVRALRQT